jgi:hypothetical protein
MPTSRKPAIIVLDKRARSGREESCYALSRRAIAPLKQVAQSPAQAVGKPALG